MIHNYVVALRWNVYLLLRTAEEEEIVRAGGADWGGEAPGQGATVRYLMRKGLAERRRVCSGNGSLLFESDAAYVLLERVCCLMKLVVVQQEPLPARSYPPQGA
jgi:hypothetical protein